MEFYTFTLKDIEPQKHDQWCWLACMKWIIDRFKIDTEFNEQWKILYYYFSKEIPKDCDPNLKNNKEYIEENFSNESIHIDDMSKLLESTLLNDVITFEELKGPCFTDKEKKEKLSYETIKSNFEINQAPYLIFSKGHIMLINGFGKIKDCEYFLLTDPFNGSSEYYYNYQNKFNNPNEILGLWILKSKNDKGLELIKDTEVEKIIKFFYNIDIQSYNSIVKNPIDFMVLNESINTSLFEHASNKSSELNEAIIGTIKNYNSNENCKRSFNKNLGKKFNRIIELENTLGIIKSYQKSEGKQIDLNEIKFYDYLHNGKKSIRLLDEKSNLKILENEDSSDFKVTIQKMNDNRLKKNNNH